jgi:ADP-heptose:LPS heptosyltransferase
MTQSLLFLINAGLGDVCNAIPVLFALAKIEPSLEIEVLCAGQSASELVQLCFPNMTTVVVGEATSSWRKWRQLAKWRRRRFDYVVSGAHADSHKTALIAYLIKGRTSLGLRREKYSFLYDISVESSHSQFSYRDYYRLFELLGLDIADMDHGTSTFRMQLKQIAENSPYPPLPSCRSGPRIAFANGADSRTRGKWKPSLKRIPNDALAKIFAQLTHEVNAQFLILGVEGDSFPESMRKHDAVLDLRGKTTVADVISILQGVDVLVCNDTGIMHLAHYSGVPFVALFGPTDPERFAPIGGVHNIILADGPCVKCQPRPVCQSDRCVRLEQLEPERVVRKVLRLLERSQAERYWSRSSTS